MPLELTARDLGGESLHDIEEAWSDDGCLIATWNPRSQTLSVFADDPSHGRTYWGSDGMAAAPLGAVSICLSRGRGVRRQLPKLSEAEVLRLTRALRELTQISGLADALDWRHALASLALLLIAVPERGSVLFRPMGIRIARELKEEAVALARWLGPSDARDAWCAAYDPRITPDRVSELLTRALRALHEARSGRFSGGDPEIREAYWWTARVLYESMAKAFAVSGLSDPAAAMRLRRARQAYLRILVTEEHRYELDQFLDRCEATTESEVNRVFLRDHGVAIELGVSSHEFRADEDEGLRRTILAWFLRRHAVQSAWRIIWRRRTWRENTAVVSFGVVVVLAAIMFWRTASTEHPILLGMSEWKDLWFSQLAIQSLVLVGIVTFTPGLFKVIMPRALFGSLAAWLTVVSTVAPKMGPLRLDQGACTDLHAHLWQAMLASAVIVSLAGALLLNEVANYQPTWRRVVSTGWLPLAILYAGSVYWGLLFANWFARDLDRAKGSAWTAGQCAVPLLVVCSAIAALAGIIVLLIWGERTIAEPFGDPL